MKLSVNLNKIALLRNSRGENSPPGKLLLEVQLGECLLRYLPIIFITSSL